jgi:hypothetical protein
MKNKIVGLIIIGVSAVMGIMIYFFNRALISIVGASCVHGPACTMWGSIDFLTNVSIVVVALVAVIGLYLVFFGREQLIITKIKTIKKEVKAKEQTEKDFKEILDTIPEDEKNLLEIVINSKGTIFQSELVEKTGLPKTKVTRILDRLEGRGLIERRRRGMTNVVILKH